jgi:hypothetical protein
MNSPQYQFTIINEMIASINQYKSEFDEKINKDINFNIDNNIVNQYNLLGDIVTKIKVRNYQKIKLNRENKVYEKMVEESNSNITGFTFKEYLFNTNNKLNMVNNQTKFDTIIGNMSDEECDNYVGNITNKYEKYMKSADELLSYYGNFGWITAKHINTTVSCYNTIRMIVKSIFDSAKIYLNERFNTKNEENFKKYINYSPDIDVSIIFNFSNNMVINKYTNKFKEQLFTLYALLHAIPETKIFANEVLNEYASVNNTEKLWNEYFNAVQKYKQKCKLNRELVPTSYFEYFTSFFVGYTSNGEIKMPLSDFINYVNFRFDIAKVQNKMIVYENNKPNKYNYIETIFDDINWSSNSEWSAIHLPLNDHSKKTFSLENNHKIDIKFNDIFKGRNTSGARRRR